MYEAVFVSPWPWWAAGIGVGMIVIGLAALANRPLSVTTAFGSLCGLASRQPYFRRPEFGPAGRWRLGFLAMIAVGAALGALAGGLHGSREAMGSLSSHLGTGGQVALLASGGVCIGFGARLAGGCTSGHSILGTALLAPSSFVATIFFMLFGAASVWSLYSLLGVA